MQFFCESCGKEITEDEFFAFGLCDDCLKKKYEKDIKIKFPKNIRISTCPICGETRIIDPVIETNLKKTKINVDLLSEYKGKITVKGKYKRIDFTFEKELPVVHRQTNCDICTKAMHESYMYLIQLRGKKNDLYKKLEDFLFQNADWYEELKEGINFYFVEKSKGKKTLGKIRKTYPKLDIITTKKFARFVRDKSKSEFKIVARIKIGDNDGR